MSLSGDLGYRMRDLLYRYTCAVVKLYIIERTRQSSYKFSNETDLKENEADHGHQCQECHKGCQGHQGHQDYHGHQGLCN